MHILKGVLASISIALTTIGVCGILLVWYIQFALTPASRKGAVRQKMDRIILWWTMSNRWMIKRLKLIEPEIHWHGRQHLSPEQWYLVVCNHQTWADILLLQTYLLDDIPPLKFFTKSQLIWLPFIGLAMSVLGFPYVKRVSKEQIKKNPALRNADKNNVLQACEGFKNHPTSILNFAEGTRLTAEKYQRQNGELKHLLNPKPGGITYMLEGMGDELHGLVNATLIYPDGVPTFWDFLQGKCRRVIFDARYCPIPELEDKDSGDISYKASVARWVQRLWDEKDALISDYLAKNLKG
jgi:1-acyl-sn-glycerol-3-phosphate acyltransferase